MSQVKEFLLTEAQVDALLDPEQWGPDEDTRHDHPCGNWISCRRVVVCYEQHDPREHRSRLCYRCAQEQAEDMRNV